MRIGTAEDVFAHAQLGLTTLVDFERVRLRAEMRARRAAIGVRERAAAGLRVAEHLHAAIAADPNERVAGYWAMGGELPLFAYDVGPWAENYALPLLRAGKRLAFAPFRCGNPVAPNRYGIPEPIVSPGTAVWEPASLAVVLVPLLAFDRGGARLGTGGGYYDRSFAFLRDAPRPLTPRLIGVAFACQELERLPVAEWDVRLDAVVTEREMRHFAAQTVGEE